MKFRDEEFSSKLEEINSICISDIRQCHDRLKDLLDLLRDLVRLRDDLQRLRIATGNRIGEGGIRRFSVCKNKHKILLKEEDTRDVCPICKEAVQIQEEKSPQVMINVKNELQELEEGIARQIEEIVELFPEYKAWGSSVKGMGKIVFARLITAVAPYNERGIGEYLAYIGLIPARYCERCNVYYYGRTVYNDKLEPIGKETPLIVENLKHICPRCRGELKAINVGKYGLHLKHSRPAKVALFIVADSLLKHSKSYKTLYDTRKKVYLDKGETKGKAHLKALRYIEKLLVSHLVEVHRNAFNEPRKLPLEVTLDNHTYIPPQYDNPQHDK